MANPNGRKGNQFEANVRDYLREQGVPCYRLRMGGISDEGDLLIGPGIGQCKNTKTINLAGALREAQEQAARSNAAFGVAIHKRRNHSISKSYVTLDLETFAALIKAVHGS